MWDIPTNVGVPIRDKFVIKAFLVNMHYTNGDAPYLNGEQAIATDGIMLFYTTDLRPKTLEGTPLINIGYGPEEMVIPTNTTQAFLTRTCTIQSHCQDMDNETVGLMGDYMIDNPSLTCKSGDFLCTVDLLQMACPKSCGLCNGAGTGTGTNPRLPESYEAVSIWYHTRLLAREFYTTFIPFDEPEERINLCSIEMWTYDDQTAYKISANHAIRPGEKIQTTCVFDSTSRNNPTKFDLETNDDM